MGDTALLAVRMEGGAVSQGYGTSRSWKGRSLCSPGASGGTSLRHPFWTSDLWKCKKINLHCFQSLRLW